MEVVWESLSVMVVLPFQDSTATLLWCAYLGIMGVLVTLAYQRMTLGKAIAALKEKGCRDPESACSAEELGLSLPLFSGSERLICHSEDAEPRYWLPEENEGKAAGFVKAASWKLWQIPLFVVGLYLLLVIVYHLIPLVQDLIAYL